MKQLRFIYHMALRYDPPIRAQRFTLRCIPSTTQTQRIEELTVRAEPHMFISRGVDGLGNAYCYGLSEGLISCFTVEVQGRAHTGLADGEPAPPMHRLGPYRYPTPLTTPGEAVARIAEAAGGDASDPLAYALRCMEALQSAMAYAQGVTDMNTTAEQAAALGQGVCQDMAHVLLALLRMKRIACRYVCGMMEGEGASHAWVEVCHEGRWLGLDPTNSKRTDDGYIRISVGRDAADCLINRGIVTGKSRQHSLISVLVKEDNEYIGRD